MSNSPVHLTTDDLKNAVTLLLNKNPSFQIKDKAQLYFQLESAYKYLSKKEEKIFESTPIVVRGQILDISKIGDNYIHLSLDLDLIFNIVLEEEGVFPITLQEWQDEPQIDISLSNVSVKLSDSSMNVLPYELEKFTVENPIFEGTEIDYPEAFLLYGMDDIISKLKYKVKVYEVFEAINYMSVAIANSK